MKTNRKNVFETNSSSCHSITFSTKGSGCRPVHTTITLKSSDFGWEIHEYTDIQSKFEYWLACYNDCANLRVRELFSKVLKKDVYESYASKDNPLPENVWDEAFNEVYSNFANVLSYLRDNGVDFYIYYDKDNHELEDYLIDFQLANNFNPEFDGINFLVEMGFGIDHQSAPYEEQAAYDLGWSSPEEVYDWIFGDGFVKTDNDNH